MPSRSRFSLPTLPLAARAGLGAWAAVSLLMAAPAAWSLGDAPATIPKSATGADHGAGGPGAAAPTPDLQAKILYNEGIDVLRRADNAAARADGADDARTLVFTRAR